MDERHASLLLGLPKLPMPEKGRELEVSKTKNRRKMHKACCLATLAALHWALRHRVQGAEIP